MIHKLTISHKMKLKLLHFFGAVGSASLFARSYWKKFTKPTFCLPYFEHVVPIHNRMFVDPPLPHNLDSAAIKNRALSKFQMRRIQHLINLYKQ
jgi:hypothetical protein